MWNSNPRIPWASQDLLSVSQYGNCSLCDWLGIATERVLSWTKFLITFQDCSAKVFVCDPRGFAWDTGNKAEYGMPGAFRESLQMCWGWLGFSLVCLTKTSQFYIEEKYKK